MPVLTHLGPAAPAGLHRYESDAFGKDYEDNLFAACFNMQKVTRHVLVPDGATFKTRDSDFVVSNNKDFHPTDVIEDADGSLLIVDTGGWYKLCCPTSQLVKPDVLGAIYRVRRKDMPQIADPRGHNIDWATWAKTNPLNLGRSAWLWSDRRPAVRRRAIEAMAKRGFLVGADDGPLESRLSAVWLATRVNSPAARAIVRRALHNDHPTVRQAALHSISLAARPRCRRSRPLVALYATARRTSAASLPRRWAVSATSGQSRRCWRSPARAAIGSCSIR